MTLLSVLAQQLLPPSLHDKHVVDCDDVDFVDTLGLVLVVLLDIARDLVRTGGRESTEDQRSMSTGAENQV